MDQAKDYRIGEPVRIDGEDCEVDGVLGDDGFYVIGRVVDGFFILVPALEMP